MIEIKVQNKGYFDADLVLFDEGETLLNSKDKQIEESREYICQATDVYGDNQVEKRSVNDLKKDKIKYCPKCNIVLFLQPITLNSRSIRKGFYRRFLTAFVKDKTPAKNIYEKRTTSNYDPDIYLKKITEYLKRLCVSNNFEFESDAFNSLGKYCLIILGHAKIKSNVTKQFCNLIEQQIFNDLIVFSILLAHSHKKYKISQDIVKLAFLDLIEIWISSFDFVDRYSTGQISYNRKWNSADERHIYVLNILEERECYDKDRSDISIRELENLIIKKFGVKERNAKRILSNMGQKRLIGKKQIGKNDSRVWLNVLPNKEKLLDYCPNAEYQKIIKEYDSLLRKINTESNKIVFVKNSTIMDNKKINSEEYIDNEDSFQKIHAFILTNQSNNYKLLLEEFGEEMISLCLKNGMICKSTPNTVRIN
jgi:hypothetical protein